MVPDLVTFIDTYAKVACAKLEDTITTEQKIIWASFSALAFSSATTCASVSTKPSWALLASRLEPLAHGLKIVA